MTGRDRIVLMVIVVAVVLGGVYLKLVSPERKLAVKAAAEVTAANSHLQSVEGQLASARSAQSSYASAYASLVELGKAVPPQSEVPALVFQLSAASNVKNVEFASISNGTTGSSEHGASASSSSSAKSAGPPTGFTPLPFTFGFEGGFHELASLLETVEGFTKGTSAGKLDITGRLLTIESLKLGPGASNAQGQPTSKLAGTVTATAYALPVSAGGGSGTGSAAGSPTPASSASTPSSPTTPAVARVTP